MRRGARGGFSIVELIVSMVILSVGALALATALGYLIVQMRLADARTQRALAVEQVESQLRAIEFDSLSSVPRADAMMAGDYEVWWSVVPQGENLRRITIHTEGPGLIAGEGWTHHAEDSSAVSLARIGS